MSITTRFRPIKGFPGYAIGETGEVISFKCGEPRILKPQSLHCGRGYYLAVSLGGMKTVHSLVAQAFLGDRPKGMVIDHIDGNRLNNHFTNLRYCSQYDNVHNQNTFPNFTNATRKNPNARPVIACKDGTEIRFGSAYEAAKRLGIDKGGIRACIVGKQRKSHGYTFRLG
jgi:hypothetical protein